MRRAEMYDQHQDSAIFTEQKDKKHTIIGKKIPRHDAWEKILGKTLYAEDYKLSNMLHLKILRSEYPAANLLSIDVSKAEQLPGVEIVITAKDVPKNETVTKFGQTHDVGGFAGFARALADKKVRFMGEAVAIVAARDVRTATKALKLIEVEYEPLEGVFDPEEALKEDAYKVGEKDTNLVCNYKVRQGDIQKGFEQADVIVENTYRVPMVDHAYIEPESGVAWMGEDNVINIRAATQVIEHFRGIAEILELPHNRVRVIAPMVGGGFGGKEDITVETFLALVVLKTGKPASLTYTREESILAHSKRHAYVMKYKTGATKDGKLVAMEAELIQDSGGYIYLSPWVLLYSTVNATGPYKIPHVKVDTCSVLTNNTFGSANRGFGATQPCFAYESQLDELARQLNMTPLEIRKKNFLHTGDALATGRVLEHAVETEATAEKALAALGKPTESWAPHIKIGQGLAASMASYGRNNFIHDTSRSYVGVELDGTVVIRCGVQDIGCGQCSSLAQIAAEVLGVSINDITVYYGDSALTPLAGTTTATRQLYMSGNATWKAAKIVRSNLAKIAGEQLKASPDDLVFKDHKITAPDGNSLNFDTVIKSCAGQGGELYAIEQFNAPAKDLINFKTGQGQVFSDFTFGSIAMEVAVDTETGLVDVLKIVSCFDVGQCINPLSAEGQMEGGAIYGLGYGMCEEVILEKGITLTHSLGEYILHSSMDVPKVQTITIESGGGIGPFGAKGIGEPASVPPAPAFSNAVADAIGVRIFELPVTPERIVRALHKI
jgi:CO/xanthine dehydrogenase Mo-binding subunit